MKVILIGSVSSSLYTLNKLIEYQFDILAVFGYEPQDESRVSGLVNMRDLCEKNNIKYYPFKRINDKNNIEIIKALSPTIIFAVGISQIISKEILSIPVLGVVGFHPTALPRGRGRAPLAWLVLNENYGAATFFLLTEGVDDGPIFIQEYFQVNENDNAKSIQGKVLKSINNALDKWLPKLKEGIWDPKPQDSVNAYYYGKRSPLDGWINWEWGAEDIDKLVRASTKPYPGAFSFYNNYKIVIWSSEVEKTLKIKGVIGRVLLINDEKLLLQTGKGLIWILEYELRDINNELVDSVKLRIGDKLGYNVEYEIFKLINK